MAVKVKAKISNNFLVKGRTYWLNSQLVDINFDGKLTMRVVVSVNENSGFLYCIYNNDEINKSFDVE